MNCQANKKPAQEHAAVWVPDGDASTCMHCLKTKFTPINRRVSRQKGIMEICISCVKSLISFSSTSTTVVSVELWCVAVALTGNFFCHTSQLSL